MLTEHVANLGEMGETVKVTDGYARNFLIPRKMAVDVESASARQIEHELRLIKKKEEKVRAQLQTQAGEMAKVALEFEMLAGEADKLFGSVTSGMIAERLREDHGYEVDRRSIQLDESIKALGEFVVEVKLGSGVTATVKVVVKSAEPEPTLEDQAEAAADALEAEEPQTLAQATETVQAAVETAGEPEPKAEESDPATG
jgi:large subunit ribosomal protein L9